jgi:hypothetical protein
MGEGWICYAVGGERRPSHLDEVAFRGREAHADTSMPAPALVQKIGS